MPDLDFQLLSTVSNSGMPKATTIASAATIAPSTYLTMVSGTVALVNITPPVTGWCQLAFVFTNAAPAAFSTAGNIAVAFAPVQNVLAIGVYNPVTNKWYFK